MMIVKHIKEVSQVYRFVKRHLPLMERSAEDPAEPTTPNYLDERMGSTCFDRKFYAWKTSLRTWAAILQNRFHFWASETELENDPLLKSGPLVQHQ